MSFATYSEPQSILEPPLSEEEVKEMQRKFFEEQAITLFLLLLSFNFIFCINFKCFRSESFVWRRSGGRKSSKRRRGGCRKNWYNICHYIWFHMFPKQCFS